MQQLVSDLLVLSKIELHADTAPIEEAVNIPMMLAGLQSDAIRLSDNANHVIEFQCDRQLAMRGSEAELSSAFGNLVFNAVLHTPENTHIIISWQQKTNCLEFSVRDNGPGIEAKHLAHLTERFYRVDKGRSRERGGTGLGLSIVRHVVHRHGGEIKIVSELGKGTTFSCEFPLETAEELKTQQ
jgi:two-component system phosphate regulon sensor histidine kinase PhoR